MARQPLSAADDRIVHSIPVGVSSKSRRITPSTRRGSHLPPRYSTSMGYVPFTTVAYDAGLTPDGSSDIDAPTPKSPPHFPPTSYSMDPGASNAVARMPGLGAVERREERVGYSAAPTARPPF